MADDFHRKTNSAKVASAQCGKVLTADYADGRGLDPDFLTTDEHLLSLISSMQTPAGLGGEISAEDFRQSGFVEAFFCDGDHGIIELAVV